MVVYDTNTKVTSLLPAAEAALYACFKENMSVVYTELELEKAHSFYLKQTDSQEHFCDSLSSLIRLNLIELVE